MGLAMVYGIVKNHGGQIEVRSEVGKGATFTMYFPSSSSRDNSPLESSLVSRISQEINQARIMVVDDDPALLPQHWPEPDSRYGTKKDKDRACGMNTRGTSSSGLYPYSSHIELH